MNNTQLVPVFTGEIQGEMRQVCNARDLHAFVESKQDFSDWIKGRIEKYGFIEGDDWVFHKFMENPSSGGRPRTDYHITIDMAKELAMVENNEKGRLVRRYFIEVEKRAQQITSRALPSISQQLSAHGVLMRLADKLEAEHHPEKRGLLHQQVQHACRILGIEPPALDAIGYAAAPQTVPAMVETFWEAVELIGLEKLNHSRGGLLVAINLLHFARVADEAKLRVPSVLDLRRVLRLSESPRFVKANAAVNSALVDGTVRCWLFEPDQPIG